MKAAEPDSRRVEVLNLYGVLDTPREAEFDSVTRLLARLCDAPIASLSLIDSERQWFKSVHGIEWESTDRAIAFCAHTVARGDVLVVEDASLDPRFADNPLVTQPPFLRFYAGVPLMSPGGYALGALAVMDSAPRRLDEGQLQALQTLATQAMGLIELRRCQRLLEEALLQRERAQAAFRDSEARWRLLFERNPLPMWIFDQETLRFLDVNDAAMVGYGWTHAEFLSMTVQDIRPPEDISALMVDIASGLEELRGAQLWRHRHKDGSVVYVDITAHSMPFHGRPGRLVMAQDVTERVHAEQALRVSEARWRRLFEASATGIISADAELKLVSANPAYCALLGRSEDSLRHVHVLALTHPDDRGRCEQELRRLLGGESDSVLLEKRYLRADGRAVWVRVAMSLMHAAEPGPAKYVAVVHDIDAYVTAQDRLQQSRALNELAGHMAALGGWAVEAYTGRVQWSNELLAILDCPSDHAPDVETTLNWYRPGSRELIRQALTECLSHGVPFDLELEMESFSHRQLAVRVIGQAIRDSAGRIVRAQGAVLDQTARKQADQVLRASEERFRNVARATADAVWDWDLGDNSVWWSDGMQTLFGHALNELEPGIESWTGRIHPDDLQRVLSGIHAVVDSHDAANNERWSDEYRFRRRAGDYAVVLDRGFVIRDRAGVARHMVGGMSDLTQQRSAEARLRQQAALLEAAQDAIIVRDLEDRVTFWNGGAERIFGWRADEALDRQVPGLLHQDPLATAQVRDELLAKGEWTATLTQRRKDGSPVSVDGRWTLLRDAEGRPNAILAIKTDVTQRLSLESQLQQLRRLEAVGQLTGGVAHDFNNLLTVILGNADLLVEQLAGQPLLLPLAEMTRTAAEQGAELTKSLLAFARKQALQPRAVDTYRLLAGMDALLRRTLPENIELELVRTAGLWSALVDPVQLESAALNLVLNARDAMPNGGRITLEVANAWIDQNYADAHADVLPGQYVLLTVSDTGSGMTPEQMARAFEPFFTTKGVGKGSGLGLSMVYGFVKQSRGHVKLYSEAGQGTTVRLYLPRAEGAVSEPVQQPRIGQDFRGSATVLVVEDDPLVRRHATDVLAGLGYKVVSAEHGDAALAVLQRRSDIELLFTDVVMPGSLNGRQLADAAMLLHPALKVLFTSGYTENAIVHHGRLDRGVQLLAKPYRSVDLARKVFAVLSTAVSP